MGAFDPYEILGVTRIATQKEVRAAFRRRAEHWHPDKNLSPGAKDRMVLINLAYELLSDPILRAQYDRKLFGDSDLAVPEPRTRSDAGDSVYPGRRPVGAGRFRRNRLRLGMSLVIALVSVVTWRLVAVSATSHEANAAAYDQPPAYSQPAPYSQPTILPTPSAESTPPSPTATPSETPTPEVPDQPTLPTSVYLSDGGAVDAKGQFETGERHINGNSYPNSVWICSDLEYISNINCNSDQGVTSWVEYTLVNQYRQFKATVGLSDSSPSECNVHVDITVDGKTWFSRQLHVGDSIPVKLQTKGYFRIRLASTPTAGKVCDVVFGDARLTNS
ncbi:MAG: DnaJ domain-containing protein [Actinomycetota bacterium]